MSKGTCKLDGCEKPRIYRLYCHMHQARLRKTGSPGPAESSVMSTDGACSVGECERPTRSRGLCEIHYHRRLRGIDVGAPEVRRYATPEEAFKNRTVRNDAGCLLWAGVKNKDGYGHLRVRGKEVLAHRFSWEQANGPIPEGKELDHRFGCSTACCEPEHLRLATHAQNCQHRVRQDSRNTSGHRGVTWVSAHRCWRAAIQVNGERIELGLFAVDQLELAAETARAARVEYFGEFAGTV